MTVLEQNKRLRHQKKGITQTEKPVPRRLPLTVLYFIRVESKTNKERKKIDACGCTAPGPPQARLTDDNSVHKSIWREDGGSPERKSTIQPRLGRSGNEWQLSYSGAKRCQPPQRRHSQAGPGPDDRASQSAQPATAAYNGSLLRSADETPSWQVLRRQWQKH